MLGTDSIVIRVHADGTFAPFARMPALFFDRSIRQILTDDADGRFDAACRAAIVARVPVAFQPGDSSAEEVLINPILDDDEIDCRFLVCWVRRINVIKPADGGLVWSDLSLDDVVTRYRVRSDLGPNVVEASPWWVLTRGELVDLWPHHTHVSAMGLGHAVMQVLITDAAEAAAGYGGGPAVRITIPSGDMLAGLIPVFHAAVRATGIDPSRMIAAIDVDLAVDADLLPIIVHLRTIGIRIDIVGLDNLTATLHRVSDTSTHVPKLVAAPMGEAGQWCGSFADAANRAA